MHNPGRSDQSPREPLAVVGIGCRFPGGIESPEAYWDALLHGINAICDVPADRWKQSLFHGVVGYVPPKEDGTPVPAATAARVKTATWNAAVLASLPVLPAPVTYEVNALRGLLIGTPSNMLLDLGVLVVAAAAGIVTASSLLGRLVR